MKVRNCLNVLIAVIFLSACVTTTNTRPVSEAEAAEANLNLGSGYLQQGRPDVAVGGLAEAHSALLAAERSGRRRHSGRSGTTSRRPPGDIASDRGQPVLGAGPHA